MSDDNVIRLPKPLNQTYYVVEWTRDPTPRKCVVCAGKRVLRVELGDGEIVTPPCDGCQRGWMGSDGLEPFDYHAGPWDFRVKTFVPTSVEVRGAEFTYTNHERSFDLKLMHDTEESAQAECVRRNEEMMAAAAKRTKYRRKKSGDVRTVDMLRYHVTRRKELRAELERLNAWLHTKGVEP